MQIYPDLRAGRSAVGGASTTAIREYEEAGEDPDDVTGDFGLTVDQMRGALAYETSIWAA